MVTILLFLIFVILLVWFARTVSREKRETDRQNEAARAEFERIALRQAWEAAAPEREAKNRAHWAKEAADRRARGITPQMEDEADREWNARNGRGDE